LDDGIDRHIVDAAKKSEQSEIPCEPPNASPARESSAAKIVSPIMPSGIKPYSIFPPDKNPAARLPVPMPIKSDACK
jgi:hypothetical protein